MASDPSALPTAAALRHSIGALTRRLRQSRITGELAWREASALSRLIELGTMTSAELARHERVSPQSMGATLRTLERRGLVERGDDREDGRRVLLSPTADGRRLHAARRDARTEELAAALDAEFTSDEIAQLARLTPLLDRLTRRL